MSKKSLPFLLAALVIILGIVLVILATSSSKDKGQPIIDDLPDTPIELSQTTDWEPEHWRAEFPASDPDAMITLETYQDGSARLIFDHKGSLEGRPNTEDKYGTFRLHDDLKGLDIILTEGYDFITKEPYDLPKGTETLSFAITKDGLTATNYDTDVYPYENLELPLLPQEERYFYGDPTELLD
jgi:hypothetical protein